LKNLKPFPPILRFREFFFVKFFGKIFKKFLVIL